MQPYHTQNGALAVALTIAGVDALRDSRGRAVPVYNIYTKEILAKHGYAGYGNIELAARDAWKKAKTGLLYYNFQRTENCEKFVAAYEKADTKYKEQSESAGDVYSSPALEISIEIEELAQILCLYSKARKDLMAIWKATVPLLNIPGPSERQDREDGFGYVSVGKYKCYSLDLNNEARKHIGVQPRPYDKL